MDLNIAELLPIAELLSGIAASSDVLIVGTVFLLTAGLMAFGIPGVVIPLSAASGALLGPFYAAATVALGGLLGSQIFFLLSRRTLGAKARAPLEALVARIETNFRRYGLWYVAGLRVAGAPHFAVTTACAVLPIGKGAFAAATFIGLLPVTFVAAAFGSSI